VFISDMSASINEMGARAALMAVRIRQMGARMCDLFRLLYDASVHSNRMASHGF
jgi:hypothetical protein